MINRKTLLAGVLAALMVSTVLAGCGQKDKAVEKAPLVKTQQADGNNSAEDSVYAGTVCGRYETNMSFQVGGQILSRNVQAGSQCVFGTRGCSGCGRGDDSAAVGNLSDRR